MALTNPNSRKLSTLRAGLKGVNKIQPCLRASLRPQTFVMDDSAPVYLTTGQGSTGFNDDIPRVCFVTVKEDDDAASVSNAQSAIVIFFQDDVIIQEVLTTGTAFLEVGGTDATATVTSGDFQFGYDTGEPTDDAGCFFMRSGFTSSNVIVSIMRLDGMTEDLHTLTE